MNTIHRAIDLLKSTRQGKPVMGCFPLYPPVELFESFGLVPAVLWNLKSSVNGLSEADLHVQNYACSVARELVQFTLTESKDCFDGLFSYNACDTLRNTPEILEAAFNTQGLTIPMLRMHVPQVNRSQSNPEQYLSNEIKLLIASMEKAFNTEFSPQNFEKAAEKYTNMRDLCLKAEKLTADGALSFSRFAETVLMGYFIPVEEQIESLEELIQEADQSKTNSGINIMISGIMPPPESVIDAIENCGLRVADNDIASMKRSYGYSPSITDDPMAYYSDFFANRVPCTTLLYQTDARLDSFLQRVKESDIRGVVFSGEKFCEYEYFEFPYLEKQLKEMGISVLFLEFAVDDDENIDAYTTRVEAFAEMLNS